MQLLPELDREYTLYEIAIVTRAGTARALGLKNKGHLGVGADADIAIYRKLDDKEAMFAKPYLVLKDGCVVVRDGRIVHGHQGRTLYVAPPYDPGLERDLRAHFQACYTISFDNYPVAPEYVSRSEVIACG